MKRYSFVAPAGVPVEFDHAGRFFTLLNCVTPIDVSLQQGGAMPEVLEAITPGIWADFEEKPFTRIRVVSPIDQHVSFLVSMVRAGWNMPPPSAETFETSLSGLAAAGVTPSPVIDLGPEWPAAVLTIQAEELTASASGSLACYSSDFPNMLNTRICVGQGHPAVAFAVTTTTNHHLASMRPTGRYVRARFQNGATPQAVGPARLLVQVMRNVSA